MPCHPAPCVAYRRSRFLVAFRFRPQAPVTLADGSASCEPMSQNEVVKPVRRRSRSTMRRGCAPAAQRSTQCSSPCGRARKSQCRIKVEQVAGGTTVQHRAGASNRFQSFWLGSHCSLSALAPRSAAGGHSIFRQPNVRVRNVALGALLHRGVNGTVIKSELPCLATGQSAGSFLAPCEQESRPCTEAKTARNGRPHWTRPVR